MSKSILLRPLISEKTENLNERHNQFTFVVNKSANKIEIKKAVEQMYNVEVTAVNTLVMPAKAKSRMSRRGMINGRVSSFKKAIVTLAEGENIDFYGDV